MTTALVLLSESGLAALGWAKRAATVNADRLMVIGATQAPTNQSAQIRPDAAPDEIPDLVRAAMDAVGEDADCIDCRGPKLHRAILRAAAEHAVQRMIMHADLTAKGDSHRSLLRRIARSAPYDVIVVSPGATTGEGGPNKIIVPQIGGGGSYALRLAASAVDEATAPILALPDPSRMARSGRTFKKALKRMPPVARARCKQAEATSATIDEATRAAIEPGDLVLVDAEGGNKVNRHLKSLGDLQAERAETPFAVAVARAADAAGPGQVQRFFERIRRYAPVLEREQRKTLYEQLETGGSLSADFVVMLTLSAAIAALGLVQSSAAVVIGAMLVAPLMTPLVAAGMAITQANVRLFRDALLAMAVGVAGALVVSLIVGVLSPWRDLSAEVLARGGPNLFDLGIAALSGVAAAYALARPGLAGTLVGVAIAVALVPPLAAVGIALAKFEFAVAGGAATLFGTNLFAIILGAALVFRVFGIDASRRDDAPPLWVRAAIALLLVGVLFTTAPLAANLASQVRRGVDRPYGRPLPPFLRNAIRERVDESPGIEIFRMAESGPDHGFGVEVVLLVTDGEPDTELVADIREIIARRRGDDARARVITLEAASPPAQ